MLAEIPNLSSHRHTTGLDVPRVLCSLFHRLLGLFFYTVLVDHAMPLGPGFTRSWFLK